MANVTAVNIKDLIKDNFVEFMSMNSERAEYVVKEPSSGAFLAFYVPLSDIGDATLEGTDKAIMFMRYLRKAISEDSLREVPAPVKYEGAKFARYRHGVAYFDLWVDGNNVNFPVPVSTLGNFGLFLSKEDTERFLNDAKHEGTLVVL